MRRAGPWATPGRATGSQRPAGTLAGLVLLAVVSTVFATALMIGPGSVALAQTAPGSSSGTAPSAAPSDAPSTAPSDAPSAASGGVAGSASGAASTAAGGASATAASDVQISDRAYAIAGRLRCPVCTAESVADSNAEISAEMRQLIQRQLDAGKSEAQILHYFTQRYGDWILLDPPKRGVHLLVWLLPLLALVGGVTGLAVMVRRWRAAAEASPPVDEAALERVRRAMSERLEQARDGEEHA